MSDFAKKDDFLGTHLEVTGSPDRDHEKRTGSIVRDWTKEEEREVRKKVDRRVFPMLCIIFGLSLLDRANMPFAFIAGMDEDLNLIGARYNIALLVFFPGYFLFELPSNAIIRRTGARLWMCFLIVVWGLSVMCMGFVRNWNGLAGLRAMLGVFEAGILPGALFILSSWYKPYEMAKRVTGFWMTSNILNAFGPILAYGLSFISVGNGIFSAGWRWIFIIEGLITIFAGLLTPLFLVEFPERANFLNDRQRYVAQSRLRYGNESQEIKHPSAREIMVMLMDWKLMLFCLQYFIAASSVYSLAYFSPIILRQGLQFSYQRAQLLSTPPVLFAVICSIAAAWLSDKIRLRWPIMCFQGVLGIIGLLVIMYPRPPGVRYFGLFIASYGIQGNVPLILSYVPGQTATLEKRGVSSAAVISAGALGGICGSTIFRAQDAPKYLPGMWTTIGLQFVLIIVTFSLSMYFKRQNRLADEGKIATLEGAEGFRYTP